MTTLNGGEPHPAAQIETLTYTFAPRDADPSGVLEASITDSRLAFLRGIPNISVTQVVVWDWTTGQILLVRRLFVCSHTLVLTVSLGARERVLPVCEFC